MGGASVRRHPFVCQQGILVEHLFVFRAVVHLQRNFRHPLVDVVVHSGHHEGVGRVVQNRFHQAWLHQFFERGRTSVVDGARIVGAIKEQRKGGGIGFLKNFGELIVQVPIHAVPSNDVVGQIRGIGIRGRLEGQGELRSTDVIRSTAWHCCGQREFLAVGGCGKVPCKCHGRMSTLGVARKKVLAVQGVIQFLAQGLGGPHHVESGIRLRGCMHVWVHEGTRAQPHVVRHQHKLPQGGHQTAKGTFNAQVRRCIGALEDGAVHVKMDGKATRVFKSLRHEKSAADHNRVFEVGHLVGHAVGIDVVICRKRVVGDPKDCCGERQLGLRVTLKQFRVLGRCWKGQSDAAKKGQHRTKTQGREKHDQ